MRVVLVGSDPDNMADALADVGHTPTVADVGNRPGREEAAITTPTASC